MAFSSSSEPYLLQEALNRGARSDDEDHEGYNALHYAVISDREVQLGLQLDKEFTQVMNAAVLISAGADVLRGDSCQCSCSSGGCAPSSKFLFSEGPYWNNIWNLIKIPFAIEWYLLLRMSCSEKVVASAVLSWYRLQRV